MILSLKIGSCVYLTLGITLIFIAAKKNNKQFSINTPILYSYHRDTYHNITYRDRQKKDNQRKQYNTTKIK